MIVLYSTLIVVLSVALFLVKRRTARLERHFARLANQTTQLLKEQPHKGNGKNPDPGETARRQYELGLAVQKRDRIEGRYTAWQLFAEKFERVLKGIRGWKGRALPYTFGILDVTGLLALLDYLGAAQYANVRALYELARSVLAG
jgi:hypothetical protein